MKKYENQILVGHVTDQLKKLPEKSVDMVMTSPPYWALRDYGSDPVVWDGKEGCEHEWDTKKRLHPTRGKRDGKGIYKDPKWKAKGSMKKEVSNSNFCTKCNAWKGELGLEPTFNLYIKHLCDVFDVVRGVLKDEGTVWVNLGDTYGGGGSSSNIGFNDRWRGKKNSKKDTEKQNQARIKPLMKATKSLVMIPFRFAIEMVNRGWILRNTIIWKKNNCMPSSAKDRFTVDFEYLFFFSKKKKYYFETQLEPLSESSLKDPRLDKGREEHIGKSALGIYATNATVIKSQGRNKRTVWTINPKPFKEAHFAVYPEELCETPIKAGCPSQVCSKCGKAREKVFETIGSINTTRKERLKNCGKNTWNPTPYDKVKSYSSALEGSRNKRVIDKGYTNPCSCNAPFTSGIVLDPFFGSGTTGLVALKQNKKFIGIDIKQDYTDIAMKRLKPYLNQKSLKDVLRGETK